MKLLGYILGGFAVFFVIIGTIISVLVGFFLLIDGIDNPILQVATIAGIVGAIVGGSIWLDEEESKKVKPKRKYTKKVTLGEKK